MYSLLKASTILATVTTVWAAECTVDRNTDGSDDTSFILKAFKDCSQDSVITFQQANYSAHTPMSFTDLSKLLLLPPSEMRTNAIIGNVTIHLEGNLNLPNNITAVQIAINETKNQPSVILCLDKFPVFAINRPLDLRNPLVLLQWIRRPVDWFRRERLGQIPRVWPTMVGHWKSRTSRQLRCDVGAR